ncbi:hypothetical protein [Herbiconiux daphne]|uniref:Uncharacterized protein n=1 Tax=Herbiconiux daphne TaxID=2970914 RepID=A0ABT2H522_9MICO|nr:hypothetical protein [Herbiconiux daphne]MCS5735004.1 hypothetical protein [Herbiconiux daphne]
MSMIHSLNWYRRHHLEHPDLALWPRAAAVTRDDVTIAGESMAGMARAVGTPCTRVSESAVGSWSAATRDRHCAIVVTAVEAVTVAPDGDGYDLWLDAELDGCEPLESTFRLIGRESRAQDALFVARPCRRYGDLQCVLPLDIRAGDLVAFVIARPVALHDIRRRSQHPERLS